MKLQTWLVMLTAMIMFFTFMGLPTGLETILATLGFEINPTTAQLGEVTLQGGGLWNEIFGTGKGILILAGVGGLITLGIFIVTRDVSFLLLPVIIFVGTLFIKTFGVVIDHVKDFGQWWMTSIVVIIFGSLAIGFLWANVDYFGGSR